jgi:hypothetical protein
MDYHSDRFVDYSLMIYDDKDLVACIPAHVRENQWYSHRGLTYGGIFIHGFSPLLFQEMIAAIEYFLKQDGIKNVEFNLSPPVYNPFHDSITQSFKSAGYGVSRDQTNMHAMLDNQLTISSKKSAGYRNGKFDDLVFKTNADLADYYNKVLEPSLQSRFGTKPIHTLEELQRLQANFLEQIIVHTVCYDNQMIAGVLYFVKDHIAKSQYAASTTSGFEKRAMDFLYQESIRDFKRLGKLALDFGTIHSPDGSISKGMRRFKEELGAQPTSMLRFEKTLSFTLKHTD